MAACGQLSMSAAGCTRPSFAAKFPDSCRSHVDEIHRVLPKLDLKLPARPK